MEIDFESPSRKEDFRTDLTPLIDVIFQLLVFFILTSSFLLPKLDIRLPQAEQSIEQRDPPRLVLSIDSEGRYFLNRETVDAANLQNAIREKLQELELRDLHFQADKELSYDTILKTMITAREAGAEGFLFLHEE